MGDAAGRNSEYVIAALVQVVIPCGIVFTIMVVDGAVHFDDQPDGLADEIYDVWSDGMLSPKQQTAHLASA